MRALRYLSVVLLTALAGCSNNVYKSYPLTQETLEASDRQAAALVYFLPRNLVRAQFSRNEKSVCLPTLSVESEVQPDPNAGYLAVVDHSYFRKDVVALTTSKGVLSASAATTTDQTLTVVQNLFDAATGFQAAQAFKSEESCPAINFAFDPSDVDDMQRAQEIFRSQDFDLEFEKPKLSRESNLSSRPVNGLVYRPSLPHKIRVVSRDRTIEDVYIFLIPNASPRIALPVKAGRFVESTNTITFSDGQPTKIDLTRPSEAMALSALPFTLMQRAISVPATMFQLRINHETKIHQAQNERLRTLNNELETLRAREQLLQEMTRQEEQKTQQSEDATSGDSGG